MPIPIKELKERQKPLEDRILEFLNGNSDKAYNLSEILRNVERYEDALEELVIALINKEEHDKLVEKYAQAINSLINRNLIEMEEVRGVKYFAIKR